MRLISMTDFVLAESKGVAKFKYTSAQIRDYANFLKQPLTLDMFVGDKALFEFQWEFKEWTQYDMENQTIEDLLSDELEYTLTQHAIKQLGL